NNANETARLAEEVTRAAGSGVDAINQTIEGINKIKDSSEDAVKVIASLGSKIGEIGKILNVIDDVAEQTNLLALNAAIIAAQAGEHGKGFAVVADEIKDLAERAGASTKEIAELIKGVQFESISEMVSQLNSAQREQARGGEQILAAVEQLREIARKQESRFSELARVVEQLSNTTEAEAPRSRRG